MICGPLVNRQIKANGYVTNKEFHNGSKIFLKPNSIYYDLNMNIPFHKIMMSFMKIKDEY